MTSASTPGDSDRRKQPYGDRTSLSPAALRRAFEDHVRLSRGHDLDDATPFDRYVALALCIRDRLMERWQATERAYRNGGHKRIYYLSAEFLTGRSLVCNLQALGVEDSYREVLADLGLDLDTLIESEPEPGLGNGGLGRLAACFLDSMATLALPGQGYGIRYEFGIFEQEIHDGRQVERADEWLRFGNPWEIARPEHARKVMFGGHTQLVPDGESGFRVVWHPSDAVMAVPHDIPIAGYQNNTVNALRLWAAKSSREFDFSLFNSGDYVNAVEQKNASEVISKVLYPNDNFNKGRTLRLRQEYFFVSCSIQDIVDTHLKDHGTLSNLEDKVAIQLNDTHPAVAVAELMRVLVDEHGMTWDDAWSGTVGCISFTNHTLMPEALERWPVSLFRELLPRHLEIIIEIDRRFVREVMTAYPLDPSRVDRMAIIDRGDDPHIHMARLAVVGSHAVNGVAALHSHLLSTQVMADFAELFPGRFSNKTNGVTPRRWLLSCNPQLAALVTEQIGSGWVTELTELTQLAPLATNEKFVTRLAAIKLEHKKALAETILRTIELTVDPAAMFDVQIKRLHEYKRQLLNILHITHLYLQAKRGADVEPRVFIFGAKAAPGYRQAKLIIRLIHDVAEVVNNDPRTPQVKVAFLPNYCVTLAERIIPAADVSEQISTAGKEASGTGNMKLSLNGALTVGTLDGANIEIREAVGAENFFLFGMTVEEVHERLAQDPSGKTALDASPELAEVVRLIRSGFFNVEEPERYAELIDGLIAHDEYCVFADFDAYVLAQREVAECYRDKTRWGAMTTRNIAHIGGFSSDRTIRQYADEIWNVSPVPVSLPGAPS